MKNQTILIRDFILSEAERHPNDLVNHAAQKFGISRQAAHKHVKLLIENEILEKNGGRKQPRYELKETELAYGTYPLDGSLEEDIIWSSLVEPRLAGIRENVIRIAHFAFTEILNNAIDHSEGKEVMIQLTMTARRLRVVILDDGIGIFRKLKETLHLSDERHVILELAKGRLTTDPERHSGEGIFWTSRMVDSFAIISGTLRFSSKDGYHIRDLLLEREEPIKGTGVNMEIALESEKTTGEIFERFAPASEDFGFTHTHVPVRLATVGSENLISRSQAKRFLTRLEKFRHVLIDFSGVDEIGQAFADEIFRVFSVAHPEIELVPINMSRTVTLMVNKALSLKQERQDETKRNSERYGQA